MNARKMAKALRLIAQTCEAQANLHLPDTGNRQAEIDREREGWRLLGQVALDALKGK